MSCGAVIAVEAPEWAYDMRPRCTACDGPWAPIGKAEEGHTPLKPIRLDAATEQRVLGLDCSKAGFVPTNLVHAFRAKSGTSCVLRIAGEIADLYEEVS
jgi:hypothetical protein